MPTDRTPGAVARACVAHALAAMTAAEAELGRLDAAAGDGDHGLGMVRGFRAAVAATADGDGPAAQVLIRAGTAFGDAAGGASGALIGVWLTAIGQALPADDEINAAAVARAMAAGLAMLERLGKAQPGDKTLIDTLDPFVTALDAAAAGAPTVAEAWRTALPAAERGMQATVDMVGKRGRAARLGERSRGHVDAGATSMFYLLCAAGEALDGDSGAVVGR